MTRDRRGQGSTNGQAPVEPRVHPFGLTPEDANELARRMRAKPLSAAERGLVAALERRALGGTEELVLGEGEARLVQNVLFEWFEERSHQRESDGVTQLYWLARAVVGGLA